MIPNPLAVWAKEQGIEYAGNDSELAWFLFGKLNEKEKELAELKRKLVDLGIN